MITNLRSEDLTNEEYHKRNGISASGLKTIVKQSVYHFLHNPPFSSSAMNLGTAIHEALFEPLEFKNNYFVLPKIDRRTKAGKEMYNDLITKNENKLPLSEDDNYAIIDISENFKRNQVAQYYSQGVKEKSFFFEIDGIECRVRPDNYNKELGFISDIKSCQDASPNAFKRDIYKYNYHLQAAFYSDALGVDPSEFVFIAVETKAPFAVQCYTINQNMIDQGREMYRSALLDYAMYIDTGVEVGYKGNEYNDKGTIIL